MTVKEAVNARRSTRYYQADKKISDSDFELIIEAGRKAPNGLALEGWKFVVLTGDFSKIEEATYGQPHIQGASHVVALINYKMEHVNTHPEVITDNLVAKGLSEEQASRYIDSVNAKGSGTQYMREQLMFAGSQMVLQAAGLGIGSVIVGGYDPVKFAEVIGLDDLKYEVGLVIDFGYAVEGEVKPRAIRPIEEVVEHIEL